MTIGTHISIITLNVNELHAPIKRPRLTEWIQKQDPYLCPLQEFHLRPKDTQTESERMKIYIPFEEITRKIKKFIETNDNGNMTTQNLWEAGKAVLGGKFVIIQS